MPLHGSEEIPACTLEIGLCVKTAAYEENRIHSVALNPMRDTLRIDAAARYGKGGSNTVDWPPEVGVDSHTLRLSHRKPAASVDIENTVTAEDAEYGAQQNLWRYAVPGVEERSRERGMAE